VPTVPRAESGLAFPDYLAQFRPWIKSRGVYGMDSITPFHHLLSVTVLTFGPALKIQCCPGKVLQLMKQTLHSRLLCKQSSLPRFFFCVNDKFGNFLTFFALYLLCQYLLFYPFSCRMSIAKFQKNSFFFPALIDSHILAKNSPIVVLRLPNALIMAVFPPLFSP